jgi:hypothetical protein
LFFSNVIWQLDDDRVMAVEYRDKHLFEFESLDAEEKRAAGKVWEFWSAGKCLFRMPTENDFPEITKIVTPH